MKDEFIESYSECLCKLLSTIGNKLESCYEVVDIFNERYIKPLEEFSKDKDSFPPRIRFIFMDCIERKKWI